MTRVFLALLIVASSACGSLATPHTLTDDPIGPVPLPGDDRTGTKEIGAGERGDHEKLVMAKDEPFTLMAGDGTSCRVSEKRFRRVRIGDKYICNWQ